MAASKRGPNGLSESFMNRANEAAFWEAWVGAVLSRAGLYTIHHPFTLAQSREQVAEYGNTWDLSVHDGDAEDCVTVEVKSANQTFTSHADWPYPDILVCSQASHNRKWSGRTTTARDFLFVSRYTGAIIWLPSGTPVTLAEATDMDRDETYTAVKADRKHLEDISDFVKTVRG